MAALIYEIFSSTALVSLGLYHLINTTRNHLKSPQSYSAKPFHPLNNVNNHRLKNLQLYLIIVCLFIAVIHQIVLSFESDPLIQGHSPVHQFTSLQSAAVLFLFLLLSLSLLISSEYCTSSDLFFALAAALFYLQYFVSSAAASVQTSQLQAKCDSISGRVSALAAILSLSLACQPRLFPADVGLGAAMCLQGLWVLQTGLSLYVEAFIPEGCHRLLDVISGVEGSTKCDLAESALRAVAVLDLLFLLHVMLVLLIVLITYAAVAKSVGIRRLGSYESLATSGENNNHIQMKSLTGTQA